MIVVTHVRDVTDPTRTVVSHLDVSNEIRLSSLIDDHFEGVVEIDGVPIERDTDGYHGFLVRAGQSITIIDLPGFGLFEGVTLGSIIASSVVGLALSTVVGFAFQALAKPNQPTSIRDEEDIRRSATGPVTTSGQGVQIPWGYGKQRVGGHIIEAYFKPKYRFFESIGGSIIGEALQGTQPHSLYLRVAFGFGPWQSLTDIEVDGNPIGNLSETTYETFLGTSGQKAPEGFAEARSVQPFSPATVVSVAGGPIIKTTQSEVDAFEIQLTWAQLFRVDTGSGDLDNAVVNITVEYRKFGDVSWTNILTRDVSAATRGFFDYWVRGPGLVRGVYEIRVTRNTADSPGGANDPVDEFAIAQIVEVKQGRRAHPGVVNVAISQIPQIASVSASPRSITALCEMQNNIRMYTSTTSHSVGYTRNPSWIALHAITHDDGSGIYYDVDDLPDDTIQDFIDWAAYCDEQVDDGAGGTEARATFDLHFRGMQLTDFLALCAQAGDAVIIERGGTWRVVILKDEPPIIHLDPRRYRRDSLTFSKLETARPRVVRGSFVNAEREYIEDVLPMYDHTSTSIRPAPQSRVNLLGHTRPSHAARTLLRIIRANEAEDAAIEFVASMEALCLEPGRIFSFASPTSLIECTCGVVVGVDGDKLRLDRPVLMEDGKSYEVTISHTRSDVPTSELDTPMISTRQLLTVPGQRYEVEVSSPLTEAVEPGDSFSVGLVGFSTELYRAESVEINDDFSVVVVAARYNSSMVNIDISGQFLPPDNDDLLGYFGQPPPDVDGRLIPPLPTNINVWSYADSGSTSVDISWVPPANALVASYRVYFIRDDDTSWTLLAETTDTRIYRQGKGQLHTGRDYSFCVVSVGRNGQSEAPGGNATAFITVPVN